MVHDAPHTKTRANGSVLVARAPECKGDAMCVGPAHGPPGVFTATTCCPADVRLSGAPRTSIAMAVTSAAACGRTGSTPAYQDELAPPPPEEPPPPDQELELELLLDHEDDEEEEEL